MEREELQAIADKYRDMADKIESRSAEEAFRYRNFASTIENDIEELEDAEDESDLWHYYDEQSSDGLDMMRNEDDFS
jgi:hypothetical protein